MNKCNAANRITHATTAQPRRIWLAALVVAALGSTSSLAQGTAYACEHSRALYTVNLATGTKTLLGNISAGNSITGSLAFDCETQTTYLAATGGLVGQPRNLYTLNLATRQTTVVGPFGDAAIIMHAIEIDARTGILYGVSIHNHGLYSISRTTGAATLIGLTGIPIGVTTFNSLGYDADNGVMYMINTGTDNLYRVNLATGAATLVGPLNGPTGTGIGGMTYNADNHTMYYVDNDLDTLNTVNLSTGASTLVGPTGVGNLIGLVYVTPNCPQPPQPGDVDGDGDVDLTDLSTLLGAFGTCAGDAAFTTAADFDGNGCVELSDLAVLLANFGT